MKGFLTQLARSTKRTFPSIIKHANKKDFRRLIQYTLEIMRRNVKIRPELKRIIRKNRRIFRHLVHPAYSMKSKRRYLIQKGGGGKGGLRAMFQSMRTPARTASALGVGPPSGSLLRSGTQALSRRQLDIAMRTRGAHHLSPAVSQTNLNTAGLRQSAVNPFTGVPDRPIGLATSTPTGSLTSLSREPIARLGSQTSLHRGAARDLAQALSSSYDLRSLQNPFRLKRIGPRGKSTPRVWLADKTQTRDLRARFNPARENAPLLDTSKQSSTWSVGMEPPRAGSRQSLNTSMNTGGEPLSRRSSIRSMEDLRWPSARQSPAGDLIDMKDILGARPITPTGHIDFDLIGRRIPAPIYPARPTANIPWPENIPKYTSAPSCNTTTNQAASYHQTNSLRANL